MFNGVSFFGPEKKSNLVRGKYNEYKNIMICISSYYTSAALLSWPKLLIWIPVLERSDEVQNNLFKLFMMILLQLLYWELTSALLWQALVWIPETEYYKKISSHIQIRTSKVRVGVWLVYRAKTFCSGSDLDSELE